jgi:hypothetical protein
MSPEPLPPHDARAMHHLVGGGIASLATAILLIRDPGVPGRLAAVGGCGVGPAQGIVFTKEPSRKHHRLVS